MTFAQFIEGGNGSVGVIGLINLVIVPIIFALAFLVFMWGLFKTFIWNAENETEKADGRKYLLWGLIGLVILFSVWGFVNLLLSTLGIAP